MAKWADYLISGIWETTSNNTSQISYVNLHVDKDDHVGKGVKTSRADAIKLIKAGKTIATMMWNYQTGKWSKGAEVDYFVREGVEYLRTHKDGKVNDNLDNLLGMNNLV